MIAWVLPLVSKVSLASVWQIGHRVALVVVIRMAICKLLYVMLEGQGHVSCIRSADKHLSHSIGKFEGNRLPIGEAA